MMKEVLPEARDVRHSLKEVFPEDLEAHQTSLEALSGCRLKPLTMFEALSEVLLVKAYHQDHPGQLKTDSF